MDEIKRSARARDRVRVISHVLARGLIAVTGVLWVAGWWAPYIWLAELASHFQVQYCLAAAVGSGLLFAYGDRRWAVIGGGVASASLWVVLPMWASRTPAIDKPTLRILSANVQQDNNLFESLYDFIQNEQPDVVVLMEFTTQWQEGLRQLEKTYRHHLVLPRDDNHNGLALYSKHECVQIKTLPLDDAGRIAISADLSWQEKTLTVIAVHLSAPITSSHTARRNKQLATLATYLRQKSDPFVAVGDFNSTPWSSELSGFAAEAKLRDCRRGFGIRPTWPAPMPLLWIPIDHCFCSEQLAARAFTTGPANGSDHFPIVVDLGFTVAH